MYMHRNAHTRARKQTCTDVGTTNMSGSTTPEDADHTHACTRIHTYAYRIRMHSHTCICVYVYVYVYMRVYVYVYVYMCAWHKQIYADEGTNMGVHTTLEHVDHAHACGPNRYEWICTRAHPYTYMHACLV